ncbi:PST family polysaccharide transporter [Polynucleobacter sphagniphilus]|uniref:oligosaccharide flippase family protein n=1 Tax=Polynucleobacter sphagniphilus TaxID=1743169 RepID=UPI002476539F|nr:oligosaccharide flippase family protein [Polynucleobacter sphagniphilus]MDH6303165.1 PST family polysaccharide transporter [Polynucleobacter sphagniphilus]
MKAFNYRANILWLGLVQGSNYLIPLLIYPYLAIQLGVEKFGLIAFALNFVQYFIVLTEYGFTLYATKIISLSRDDNEKLSKIFCTVMSAKIILMILGFFVYSITIFNVEIFKSDWKIYIFAYLSVLGNVIFPIWYYQGMDDLKNITIINILSKLIMAGLIILFIKSPEDYELAILIQSSGTAIAGILTLRLIWYVAPIKIIIPSSQGIIETYKNGWHLFITTASVTLYSSSTVLILGLITNTTQVGFYSIAEKIIAAAKGMVNPILYGAYARINYLTVNDKNEAKRFTLRIAKVVSIIFFLGSTFLYFSSGLIFEILLSNAYTNSVDILKAMAYVPFLASLSSVIALFIMIPNGMEKKLSQLTLACGIFNIATCAVLAKSFSGVGAALSVTFTELLILLSFFIFTKRAGKI